jgi:hypothetical protein
MRIGYVANASTAAILLALVLSYAECRAENAPPDGADGFGCFYDETFVNTVVYARCDWMTFFYNYSGFDPMMPAPGWIQVTLSLRGDYSGADEVVVQLDGRAAFELADYPFFGLTPSQLQNILNAKTVVFEARWWTEGRRVQNNRVKEVNRRERLVLRPSGREFLRALSQFGKNWSTPKDPWMIRSSIGYVIDTSGRMGPKFRQVQQMIDNSILNRSLALEQYCIVAAAGNEVQRSPDIPRHVAYYQGNEPERGAKARAFVDSLVVQKQSPPLDVGSAVSGALGQQMQTVVLFTAGGTKLEDFDDTLSLLHQKTARLFVLWCAGEKDDTKGQAQLKKLCELTGGSLIYAQ